MDRYDTYIAVFASAALVCGCTDISGEDPYSETLNTLTVVTSYPEDYDGGPVEGMTVSITDIGKGTGYSTVTGADGKASLKVLDGIYRVTVSHRHKGNILRRVPVLPS